MRLIELYLSLDPMKRERDFVLSSEDINILRNMDDNDRAKFLLWVLKLGVSKDKLEVIEDKHLWMSSIMGDPNKRTSIHSFVKYLIMRNPILKSSLSPLLEKL